MFKPGRWWSEKNRLKVVFKLQFHASQVTEVGVDGLMLSVVPGDTGKTSVKSETAAVRDGKCLWENPIHETVKFNRDPKSGKIHQRIYYFVVAAGSSKSGFVGEASIDFSSYVEISKVSLVSLPLKNSKTEAILHVSIQRVHQSVEQREMEENENANLYSEDHSVKSELGDHDVDGSTRTNSLFPPPCKAASQAGFDATLRVSSGSDITLSSSGSSSGLETHWEAQVKNDSMTTPGPKSDMPSPLHKEHWEWLRDSALKDSFNDTKITPKEAFLVEDSEEAPDIVIDRLKADVAALSRQAEMSELELQTLRKQVLKESKRGQDFWKEIVCLKEERDALKGECQELKAFQRSNAPKTKYDGADSQAIIEELRQELNHANELNTNLRIQVQKTQESNSELILAVQDLEEMLQHKNENIPIPWSRSLDMDRDDKSRETALTRQPGNDDDDDEESRALEDIVREHNEVQESVLEQEILNLQNEIEMYKRDKDELEMQMEQLALDYEIVKQANHDMACKLEQSQIHEQLKMQYECSSSDIAAEELGTEEIGTRIESLENELQGRIKEYEDSLATISELEGNVKSLEKELEKQAQEFKADAEALTQSRVQQEQRAIRAEESMKKMRWKNANAAERLQDEFKKLSVQMASTFEANEKLATKALAEATELRLQKSHLEEMLKKISEEHQSVESHYEDRLQEANRQIAMMANQIEQLQSNIEDKSVQLEHQKKHVEESQRLLSNEILMLKEEVEEHIAKNKILLEDMENKEGLVHELERMKMSVKEMELLVEQGNDEKIELERRVILMKTEAEVLDTELNKMSSLVKEKESVSGKLQSDLDSLQARCTELQHSLSTNELEKENLKKQVVQLRSDLKKKEDGLKNMEKKARDASGRATTADAVKTTSKTSKPSTRATKEVANLKEKIKLLEGEIKAKETALEKSVNTFLEKEEVLHKKIEELEVRLNVEQSSTQLCDNKISEPAAGLKDQTSNGRLREEVGNIDENSSTTSTTSSVNNGVFLSGKSNNFTDDELKNEMALVMERNKSMERELKEMEERYSDMSLKFAEVEGERQQLVMKLRNVANAKNSSHSTNVLAPVYW